jgi:hypothetical protein
MKKVMTKIWVPALLILGAALQSFGIDAGRAARLYHLADSLSLTQITDTISVPDSILPPHDTLAADSLITDSTLQIALSPKDTIKVPDSLRETDPFKYKYYIALKDSTVRFNLRDSLFEAGDSLELAMLDSLYIKDSIEVAKARYDAWYASLSRRERKKEDARIALPGLIAAANRKVEIKDSIKAYRDSVRQSIPRILDTYAIPDSLHYKRIITWQRERDFQDLMNIRNMEADTSYKRSFYDYPFFNEDINATWLGVSGSPLQMFDYFKRQEEDNAVFYTPYMSWNYTSDNLP